MIVSEEYREAKVREETMEDLGFKKDKWQEDMGRADMEEGLQLARDALASIGTV